MPYPKIALSPPYPAAAKFNLAVPTPVVSVATTPELDTKFVIDTLLDENPKPNMALSPPYPAAAKFDLAVPTPEVLVATTPAFETRFVKETLTAPEDTP